MKNRKFFVSMAILGMALTLALAQPSVPSGGGGAVQFSNCPEITASRVLSSWNLSCRINATAGNITVTLPPAVSGAGRVTTLIRSDSSANTVTIQGANGVSINGSSTLAFTGQWDGAIIQSNGVNYAVIGKPGVSGQMVDYARVSRTTNQTLALNGDVLFNSAVQGNIPYNPATGIFTLSVGKTYALKAGLKTRANTTSGYVVYQWVNVANTPLTGGTEGVDMQVQTALNEGSGAIASAIFTPSTLNTQVKVRVTGTFGGPTLEADSVRSWAEITQLGTTGVSSFGGATASSSGTAGFVPAPVAGEQDKCLTGAGTWGTCGGGTLNPVSVLGGPFTLSWDTSYSINASGGNYNLILPSPTGNADREIELCYNSQTNSQVVTIDKDPASVLIGGTTASTLVLTSVGSCHRIKSFDSYTRVISERKPEVGTAAPITQKNLLGEVAILARACEDVNGWLCMDGRAISRTTYADLFNLMTNTLSVTTINGSAIVEPVSIGVANNNALLGAVVESPNVQGGATISSVTNYDPETRGAVGMSTTDTTSVALSPTYTDPRIFGAALLNTRIVGANINATARLTATSTAPNVVGLGIVTREGGFPFLAHSVNQAPFTYRPFIAPAEMLGITPGTEARVEFSSASTSFIPVASGTRIVSGVDKLYWNRGFLSTGTVTNPYCNGAATGAFATTCGAQVSAVYPGQRITTNLWTGGANTIIRAQTCPNGKVTATAIAVGGSTFTITEAYSPTTFGTAQHLYTGDFIRIGQRVFGVRQTNMTNGSGANYVVTLDRAVTEAIPAGTAIVCLGRAAAYPSVNQPTITVATVGNFTVGSTVNFTLSSTTGMEIHDYLYPQTNASWGCRITALAGNVVTCLMEAGTAAAQTNAIGQFVYRAPRFELRRPTGVLAPAITSVLTLSSLSNFTVLDRNVLADSQVMNYTNQSYQIGGVVTMNLARTGFTPFGTDQVINMIPRLNITLAAIAAGVTTFRILPYGQGDGVTTFNLPDARGRVLATVGKNGAQTVTANLNFQVGSTAPVATVLGVGSPFIFAGP